MLGFFVPGSSSIAGNYRKTAGTALAIYLQVLRPIDGGYKTEIETSENPAVLPASGLHLQYRLDLLENAGDE